MKTIVKLLIISILLFSTVTPVYAADPQFPPLPEWPIIGPVLKWLGIIKPEPEPLIPEASVAEVQRDIPEYTIATLDDLRALEELEPETAVRLSASAATLNALLAENTHRIVGLNYVTLSLEENRIGVDAQFNRDILKAIDIDFPLAEGSTLNLTGHASLDVQDCRVTVTLEELKVNRIGIPRFVGPQLDTIIAENWPDEVCVESLTLKEGEIVAEGYRK